jgi:hypothetical protein
MAVLVKSNVIVDSQLIGEIGSGQTIELELPVGTHNITLSTNVTYGVDLFSTTAATTKKDGRQFQIRDDTNQVLIKVKVQANWLGGSGRCIIAGIFYE